MLRNYFKIALRNLWKNKTYSFINIFGLTLGLVCFLLIALYVFDELTYDGFHKNASRIYRVVETKVSPEGKETKVAAVAYKISGQSPLDIPEVKMAARFSTFGRANVSAPGSTNVFYESFNIANPDFLNVFDFKLLEGDRKTALKAPQSVILTEDMAKKLFGVSSAVGKSVERDSILYTVTGILQNFPSNSHISFNMIFSEASFSDQDYLDFIKTDWSSNTFPRICCLLKTRMQKKRHRK